MRAACDRMVARQQVVQEERGVGSRGASWSGSNRWKPTTYGGVRKGREQMASGEGVSLRGVPK
jgi:hypothetical protein